MPTSYIGYYCRALREVAVWKRAARLGIVVGLVHVCVNQGDHWVHGHVTATVVLKSATSLLFSILVVLVASASTRVETLRSTPPL